MTCDGTRSEARSGAVDSIHDTDAQTHEYPIDDLRSFIASVRKHSSREFLSIDEPLDGDWQLAGVTTALVRKMRMPVICFNNVNDTPFPVLHNVCASLSRIARSAGWSVSELEDRLTSAYDNLVPPVIVEKGPIRDHILVGNMIDLSHLPGIRYTETETHPYISAAHIVAVDPGSGALNVSFHRLMMTGKKTLAIYMTPNGHLDQIFQHNVRSGRDTPIAAFIGAHPLWSLGSLAAGSLSLDELSVTGGLLGYPLPVVRGLQEKKLLIPSHAEMVLEGMISQADTDSEGPYGEAFGYVSQRSNRPVFHVQSLSHREQAYFQDIVPSQFEHMTMTGVATLVYLKKTLKQEFDCITDLVLPTAMTVYIAVSEKIRQSSARDILLRILKQQRFVKQVILFDDEVDITQSKQTQQAIALNVQAVRDIVMLPRESGNGLDPSETEGMTDKWGIDASSYAKHLVPPVKNTIPQYVMDALDIKALLEKAKTSNGQ